MEEETNDVEELLKVASAMQLLTDFLILQCNVSQVVSSGRRISRKLSERERKILSQIFEAMVGRAPIPEELDSIVGTASKEFSALSLTGGRSTKNT